MHISIKNISYSLAETNHYRLIGKEWVRNLEKQFGPQEKRGDNWLEAGVKGTCALRISVALTRAGVNFAPVLPNVRRKWYHTKRREYYPAKASDYPEKILTGGERLNGSRGQRKQAIQGRKGITYFGGNMGIYSGHMTFWNGHRLHYPADDGGHWNQPKVWFWKMR